MKRLVLIDGHAILHRAYHAFPTTLKTRKGELVNAAYGFTRILLSVLQELKPNYLAVAFDLPEPTFRHREYVGYQVHRPKTDEELIDQIARVYQIVESLNIPIFSKSGFEADDVIGTLSWQAQKKDVETIIVTGDKDIMQLVDNKVKVYLPARGIQNAEIYDRKRVKDKLGVWPKQIIDYKGLVGDPSDNYPGIPGIGPKTAVDLLDQYQNLDSVFKNVKKLKPLLEQKIKQGKESGLLSQKLARIVRNVSVKLNLKACQVHDYDFERVAKLFEELEFKSLLKHLPGQKAELLEKITGKKKDKEREQQISLL